MNYREKERERERERVYDRMNVVNEKDHCLTIIQSVK